MLKSRLITAVILIPIVVACIFFLPPMAFLSVALLAMLLAGWEWSALGGIENFFSRILYLALMALILISSLFIPILFMIIVATLWWIVVGMLLILYPERSAWGDHNWIRATMGFFVLVPCWIGIIILQGYSPMVLMFCLVLIWAVDSAAYFVGKKWGKHKMAPTISPGKSYEGLIAGLIVSLIMGILGLWLLEISSEGILIFLLICVVGGGLITVLGDLFESMVKRKSNVKDSGGLLPGHGGILDRIDSMTTAIPFFALFIPYFFSS